MIMFFFFFRILGLPPEHDWPENVTLPWGSFKPLPPQQIQHYIPEIESDAQDLLEVSKSSFVKTH